jgi:Holliday junction resolvase
MTINSRAKGAAAEREVAEILRANGYTDARRGQQFAGGPESPDVIGIPGFHLEVKRVENFSLYPAMDQAERDSGVGELPVVVHRKSHRRWVAILDFEKFLDLISHNKDIL